MFSPLAVLAALRGGRARVHEKKEVKRGLKTSPNVPNKGARAGPSARLRRMREARPSVSSQFIPLDKRATARAAWETCSTRPAARGTIAIVARKPPRPSFSHRRATCRQI